MVTDYTAEDVSFLTSTNFESAYNISVLAHPLLKASAAASAVFISSVAGTLPLLTAPIYGANKEDFKNTRIQPEWTAMDYLLEVVRVDQEKMQEQTFMNKKKNGRLKRKCQIQEENNKNKRPITSYPPKPLMPEGLKQHIVENMGGSNCALVIQKQLFFSDVNPQASRLLIPFSQVESHEFLNKSEVELLKNKEAIKACLVEPSMLETEINFKRWDMRKKSMYVVTTSWNSIVKNNKLKAEDVVQLLSFRVNSTLCFVLQKL
ncbi:hypothetical protein PVK06_049767 [Gossypium arboreum]|uniref:Uncharacterized protein n=1 Tax=Gossypium arboreum TaxID=29729 RepID=A0ABR0MJL0_GOSAR|nr:hypothetical protein PVK06_049767 [Gossypium arboreum]